MRPLKLIKYYFFLITFLCLSCNKAVITQQRRNDKIDLSAPADHLITPNRNQVFSWTDPTHASSYQFQLLLVGNNNTLQLIVDTIITSRTINLLMNQGSYEWWVKGLNAGIVTSSDTNLLTIH